MHFCFMEHNLRLVYYMIWGAIFEKIYFLQEDKQIQTKV